MMSSSDSASHSFRCGMVSIVGRPNVGKSTLLNTIVGEKVAIVSKAPQTTRNRIRGIYNDDRGQIIFTDTPGLFLGKDKLDQLLKSSALSAVNDVDCIIHLVDVGERTGEEEAEIVQRLKDLKIPIILGVNKIDRGKNFLPEYLNLWEEVKGAPVRQFKKFTILPLSGASGLNVDKLMDILFDELPSGPALYPRDAVTDLPERMLVSDIIREKIIYLVRDEIPHAIAVVIQQTKPRRGGVLYIQADVMVERESQREIIIGRKGAALKEAGSHARQDLENLLHKKVFLDLFVKVKKHWREDMSLLEDMGCGQ